MTIQDDIITYLPDLKRYAFSLLKKTSSKDSADDLVQQTILLALEHQHQFIPNTNLIAWLMTIMHNYFWQDVRLLRNKQPHLDISVMLDMSTEPVAIETIYYHQVVDRMKHLTVEQQSALLLTGEGYKIEEIADIEHVEDGTIKSRIHRGRKRLEELLS